MQPRDLDRLVPVCIVTNTNARDIEPADIDACE